MLLIITQVSATLAALLLIMVWPPAVGRILIIPLADQPAGRVINVALDSGARLLGTGPTSGSMIVVGERASIARHLKTWNFVMLAAPPAGCGDAGQPA